jgi:tetratricopeptide (TPR) repeat protein
VSLPGCVRQTLRAAVSTVLALSLGLGQAWALSPLEKNHPLVEEGREAFQDGKYEDALKAFDEAKKALPSSAAVDYNRGNALYKLGRLEEAKEAYLRAQSTDKGELRQKDFYNLGNTYAQMGDRTEAIRAYRKALTLDPKDPDARHNLEVVLKNLPPPKTSPDGGTDGGAPDAGKDGGSDAGHVDAGSQEGSGDGGTQDGGARSQSGEGGKSDAGLGDGGAQQGDPQAMSMDAGAQTPEPPLRDGGTPEPERLRDGGTAIPVGMSREEAERLLDAMKQHERNLQLWKFQQKRPRKPNEKDW